MSNPQISLFLHGLALKDELVGILNPKQKVSAYRRYIKQLAKLSNEPFATEAALSWVDYQTLKHSFSDTPEVLRVVHAPFVKGDKPNQISGAQRFVDLFATPTDFEVSLVKMIRELRSFIQSAIPITIIFHPLPYRDLIKEKEALLDKLVQNLRRVCFILRQNNIFIAIENLPFFTGVHSIYNVTFGTKAFFVDLLHACTCPNVGITFDFGHANSTARYLWENNRLNDTQLSTFEFQKDFLEAIKERIFHIHFHYNPAHNLTYNLGINKFIHKLKNYDFHDSITKYGKKDWQLIKRMLRSVIVANKTRQAPLTITLEVLPRSLNPANSYLKEVRLFKNTVLQ